MCRRYSIYESMDHYLKELAPEQLVINGYDLWRIERYNVAPTTRVDIIRPIEDGLSLDKVRWGWSPFWARGEGKRPAPINARVETCLRESTSNRSGRMVGHWYRPVAGLSG
jgi:putative SOS response-associated peptidase YedK